MGIKTSLAGEKGEVSELQKGTTTTTTTTANSSSRQRRSRRKQGKMTPPVQTLFNTCKELFANGGFGFVPPPADIRRVCSLLGNALFVSSISDHFFCAHQVFDVLPQRINLFDFFFLLVI